MAQSPYREQILEHYQHPRHRGRLENPDRAAEVDNSVCGDTVRIELKLDAAGRVVEAAFDGEGCVISIAAASMLTEHALGRTASELGAMVRQDVLDMLGVTLGPVRSECAILPLRALHAALE